jgi:hypothetical protein
VRFNSTCKHTPLNFWPSYSWILLAVSVSNWSWYTHFRVSIQSTFYLRIKRIECVLPVDMDSSCQMLLLEPMFHYHTIGWFHSSVVITSYIIYTGCPRRNVPDFRRVFLVVKYTDITQNTYVQSWTVMEIMAREKCGLLAGLRIIADSWQYLFDDISCICACFRLWMV